MDNNVAQRQVMEVETYERSPISLYPLASLGGEFTFFKKLQKETGWQSEYALRAIEEYKRFCFLAITQGHPVSPSDPIDKVWHLHLIYTREYWEHFCPNILKKTLHHHPSQGGAKERRKFESWFADTVASYEAVFGELPPRSIWKPEAQALYFTRARVYKMLLFALFFGIFIFASTALRAAPLDVLELQGPEFLALIIPLEVLSVALVFLLPFCVQLFSTSRPYSFRRLSSTELGLLLGGSNRAILVAIAELEISGAISADNREVQPRSGGGSQFETELELRVFDAITRSVSPFKDKGVLSSVHAIRAKLEEQRLLLSGGMSFLAHRVPLFFVSVVGMLGMVKSYIGITRNKPIVFLILSLISLGISIAALWKFRPRTTLSGKRVVKNALNAHRRLGLAAKEEESPLAVALFGVGAISMLSAASCLHEQYATPSSHDWTSSSCSTDSCGSSCGGGCGGCGGD